MIVPKVETLEYCEQQMKKAKFILDALQSKIKEQFCDPTFVPTANQLYFFAQVLDSAEREYDLASKEFEVKNNELYPDEQENRRNEDY